MISLQRLVSLNGCGVCGVFDDVNGSVKGVSSAIAAGVSDGAFGCSKDTVDGSRGVFDKANGGGLSVGNKLPTCLYT